MHLPYDVLKDLIYFHDRINDLFERKLISIYPSSGMELDATWTPTVDIYETADHLVLTAELPGVDLEDIRIQVTDGELSLSGRRPFPPKGRNQEGYRRLEGGYGLFERHFHLPLSVDRDGIKATLRDGVLKVVLPTVPAREIANVPIENP